MWVRYYREVDRIAHRWIVDKFRSISLKFDEYFNIICICIFNITNEWVFYFSSLEEIKIFIIIRNN